jgi:phosphoenolpyruvate carboxylase
MTLFKSDLDISKFYDQKLPFHLHELGNKLREKLNTMYDINEMLQAFYHESNGYKSETTMTNLEYRTPYIDPLNLVQAHVMHEMKNVNSDTKQYQLYLDALMLSIAGIAAGIKNTG